MTEDNNNFNANNLLDMRRIIKMSCFISGFIIGLTYHIGISIASGYYGISYLAPIIWGCVVGLSSSAFIGLLPSLEYGYNNKKIVEGIILSSPLLRIFVSIGTNFIGYWLGDTLFIYSMS